MTLWFTFFTAVLRHFSMTSYPPLLTFPSQTMFLKVVLFCLVVRRNRVLHQSTVVGECADIDHTMALLASEAQERNKTSLIGDISSHWICQKPHRDINYSESYLDAGCDMSLHDRKCVVASIGKAALFWQVKELQAVCKSRRFLLYCQVYVGIELSSSEFLSKPETVLSSPVSTGPIVGQCAECVQCVWCGYLPMRYRFTTWSLYLLWL